MEQQSSFPWQSLKYLQYHQQLIHLDLGHLGGEPKPNSVLKIMPKCGLAPGI